MFLTLLSLPYTVYIYISITVPVGASKPAEVCSMQSLLCRNELL